MKSTYLAYFYAIDKGLKPVIQWVMYLTGNDDGNSIDISEPAVGSDRHATVYVYGGVSLMPAGASNLDLGRGSEAC
ncbi:MAG TPA: hypothetical protein PLN21_08955 [Gemmatales bacterium]|nr:hypothetical protein [Gemmatales bacterium]